MTQTTATQLTDVLRLLRQFYAHAQNPATHQWAFDPDSPMMKQAREILEGKA